MVMFVFGVISVIFGVLAFVYRRVSTRQKIAWFERSCPAWLRPSKDQLEADAYLVPIMAVGFGVIFILAALVG
jgi:hypothetical protein